LPLRGGDGLLGDVNDMLKDLERVAKYQGVAL